MSVVSTKVNSGFDKDHSATFGYLSCDSPLYSIVYDGPNDADVNILKSELSAGWVMKDNKMEKL